MGWDRSQQNNRGWFGFDLRHHGLCCKMGITDDPNSIRSVEAFLEILYLPTVSCRADLSIRGGSVEQRSLLEELDKTQRFDFKVPGGGQGGVVTVRGRRLTTSESCFCLTLVRRWDK